MLSIHVRIAVDCQFEPLEQSCTINAPKSETQILCTGSAGRQCKVQVVAALVIRDAVGDAISRQQAAVKPGPWPGRRAARRSALAGALVVPPQRTEPSAGYVHGRTFTWPHVVSVYLYLRRSETGLPLPEAPHASPTSTCAPGPPRAERVFNFAFWRGGEADLWCLETGLLGALGRVPGGTDKTETQKRSAVRFSSPAP